MIFVPEIAAKRAVKKAKKKSTELGEYLDSQFLEWRRGTPGERGSFAEWSRVVKINENILKSYINRGSLPTERMVAVLVDRFGARIYSLCDAFPPEPIFRRIAKVWWRLTDAEKEEVAELADRYAEQSAIGKGGPSLEKTKR